MDDKSEGKAETGTAQRRAGLLYGVPQIASYLGIKERQARHQIREGRIPTFRLGRVICTREAEVEAWIESAMGEQRAAALAATLLPSNPHRPNRSYYRD